MFDDQELHESIQAFKEMGAEFELQPMLAFLAATRARTVRCLSLSNWADPDAELTLAKFVGIDLHRRPERALERRDVLGVLFA